MKITISLTISSIFILHNLLRQHIPETTSVTSVPGVTRLKKLGKSPHSRPLGSPAKVSRVRESVQDESSPLHSSEEPHGRALVFL
jgi:hypothetical protein